MGLFAGLVRRIRPATQQASSTPQPAPVDPLQTQVRMGELLGTCTVPDEELEQELGEPLMTRTITKALAVAGAMAAAVPQPIALLRPVLATLRTITMGGYRAATATNGLILPLLLIGGGALVVGIVLAIYNTSVLGFAGAVLAATGFYLIAITTGGRSRKSLTAFAAGLGIVGLLARLAERSSATRPVARVCAPSKTSAGPVARHCRGLRARSGM